jgi:hypothetical protein
MGTIAFPNAFKNQHFDPPRARFLRSIKARKLAGDFPRTTSLNAHQNARRIGGGDWIYQAPGEQQC